MLTISKNANPNYLAKVVKLKGLKKHNNADRLQVVIIDFQNVITGLDAKEGDIYVFFPLESKIDKDFLSYTNSFRDKELNVNKEKTGFFEKNCRVKAAKLRGEKSMGYIVPVSKVINWSGVNITDSDVNKEFDTIGDKLILEKYKTKSREPRNIKQGQKPKVSRLIDGQVRLHVNTENLRKNSHKIQPDDIISVTYKTHGTSFWVSNILVNRKLNLAEKIAKKVGLKIEDTEYDIVYGSRKVVKNAVFNDSKNKQHYFGYDLWLDIKEQLKEKIPKGYTLYGEMLGYDKKGKFIQKDFDYGCDPNTLSNKNQSKLEIYRITNTTPDGLVTELSYPEIKEFCEKVDLTPSHLFYYGEAKNLNFPTAGFLDYNNIKQWQKCFVEYLEMDFNEKDCFMCTNKVPEEGIVVRKESLFECNSFKLKSFRFLEKESKQLDTGEENIEDQ